MLEFKDRLRKFREEYAKMNKSEFADYIKTKQQYIGWWESGRNKPGVESLALIEAAYPELNMDWLVGGKGEMILSSKAIITSPGKEFNEVKRLLKENEELKIFRDKYIELQERYSALLERVNNLKK